MSSDAPTSPSHERLAVRSWARLLLIDVPIVLLASLILDDSPRVRVRRATSTADPRRPSSSRATKRGFLRTTYSAIRQAVRQMDLATILRRSAALAYYAALSLAPLIVVAVGVAGLVFDKSSLKAALV